MAEETFSENLLRAAIAQLHLLNGMTAAREMYGKGYFALGVMEKATVDQTVINMIATNYQAITAEYLATPKASEAVGFLAQVQAKSDKN